MVDELYEDVLKEEPKYPSKEYKKWEKRLHTSVGWIDLLRQDKVFIEEKKGKTKIMSSTLGEDIIVWDVELGDGGAFTCEKQVEAQMLSLIAQTNKRLERLENTINKRLEQLKKDVDTLSSCRTELMKDRDTLLEQFEQLKKDMKEQSDKHIRFVELKEAEHRQEIDVLKKVK